MDGGYRDKIRIIEEIIKKEGKLEKVLDNYNISRKKEPFLDEKRCVPERKIIAKAKEREISEIDAKSILVHELLRYGHIHEATIPENPEAYVEQLNKLHRIEKELKNAKKALNEMPYFKKYALTD